MKKTTGESLRANERLEKAREALWPLKEDPRRAAVLSDVDGTISAIARKPDEAVVAEETKRLIHEMNERYGLVCLVTGRDVETVAAMLSSTDLTYVGSHGLETSIGGEVEYAPGAERYLKIIPSVAESLRRRFDGGVLVEEKRFAIGLHYRQAPDREDARRRIMEAIEPILSDVGLKWMPARYAVELRPDLPADKGSAILKLLDRFGSDASVYLGDDTTDLAAFSALEQESARGKYAVKAAVASAEMPPGLAERADIVLESVDEVIELFQWLVNA